MAHSPQRKRASKRYSSRWSSGVQLETLLESQENLLTSPEARQNHVIVDDEDGDWETVFGGSQQFLHPYSSSGNLQILGHSDAGSSIADYTSFASFDPSEAFMNSPGSRRRRRRYTQLSSSPWNDASTNFLRVMPLSPESQQQQQEQQQQGQPHSMLSSHRSHPSNALSDGGYPKLPPSPRQKKAVVPVLSSTFTYHHPTPLQRSHSNPFKVTPPYLDWRYPDDGFSDDDDDGTGTGTGTPDLPQENTDLPSGTVIHHRTPHYTYTSGASIAGISTGPPSAWPSSTWINASSPATATPQSISAYQPSTPCPYERVYEGRYPLFPPQNSHQQLHLGDNGLQGINQCPLPNKQYSIPPKVDRVSRAESPTSWYGSICNVSDADADVDLTESFEGAFPDSVDLLWQAKKPEKEKKKRAKSYYSSGTTPRFLKVDITQGLRRLSGMSSTRQSRKSFVPLPDDIDDNGHDKRFSREPEIPEPCFIREVSTQRLHTGYPSQPPKDLVIPVRDSSKAHTYNRNSVLSFRTHKHEDELLRKRLTRIDLGSFTDIELGDLTTTAVLYPRPALTADERVQGWLSSDMGETSRKPNMTIESPEETTQEWFRSQHGKYTFSQPPRLIAQPELQAIRRKSIQPRPPSSHVNENYLEIEYIVKQRRMGKQILLFCSLLMPIGWLVVAYVGFEGARSNSIMHWRSYGAVAGFHEKEVRLARGLAVVQIVVVLVMVVVLPATVLA
ncbi:hypothetical protein AAP_02912 [Ascosphaera apis ARSEF 7405]|uniref:Uncharacterized protein n=1 Tax=Ascosphaera apis ARSEF 7405 TaxID=392613 RepID=A0A167Z710_9EURO|nr:hypothetical protein AAP_02912 [Ascosphaera apis ARSEF 7405]